MRSHWIGLDTAATVACAGDALMDLGGHIFGQSDHMRLFASNLGMRAWVTRPVLDTTSMTAALVGLVGFRLLTAAELDGELELLVETTADLVGCPRCGAVGRAKDRRPTWVRDLPIGGRAVVLCWWKRVWCCPYSACEVRTWTERHEAVAPRAVLTERARQWAFEQVGEHDAAVAAVAAELGVAWWTVMEQVLDRGTS